MLPPVPPHEMVADLEDHDVHFLHVCPALKLRTCNIPGQRRLEGAQSELVMWHVELEIRLLDIWLPCFLPDDR